MIVPKNILNSSATLTSEGPQPIMTIRQPSINHPTSGTAKVHLSSPPSSLRYTQFLMRRIRNAWSLKYTSTIIANWLGRISAVRFLKRPSSAKDMHISTAKSLRTVCWWLARKSRASLSKFLNHPNFLNRSFQHCGVFCILNVGVSGLI